LGGFTRMKITKAQLLMWCIGFLAPVWLLVVERLMSAPISGAWLYGSIIIGALVCAVAIAVSSFSVWQRVALVFASWLLLVGEVLTLGAFLMSRHGLRGVQ
jgi:hypothetical protein